MAVYHSHYQSDCYELYTRTSDWMREDEPTYWKAYKRMRAAANPQTDKYIVLDVATGTGRVIRNLVKHLLEEETPADCLLTGIDISQPMLDIAQRSVPSPGGPSVSYVAHSALELESLETPPVDMLIIAVGSISHLYEPGQAERCLAGIARVLRRGSGLAYVSVLNTFLEGAPQHSLMHADEKNEHTSVAFPGIMYRQSERTWEVDGNLVRLGTKMEVIDSKENRVIESETSISTLRAWGQGELPGMARQEGLGLVETIVLDSQTIYVLRRED